MVLAAASLFWVSTAQAAPHCADAPYPMGSGQSYADYAAPLHRTECTKDWTVLVYMSADNDLAPFAYWDLYEMEAGYKSGKIYSGSTYRSDVLVQFDAPKAPNEDGGIRRLHIFQSPHPYTDAYDLPHFKAATPATIESPVVETLPKDGPVAPEAHEERFREFLRWGMSHYPSKHYLVVVWGHGRGWQGVGFDSTQKGYLSIPALRRSFQAVSDEFLDGDPIDVYAADSCLMQMIEVATELAPVTRFMVGSTQVQNFLGLPYRRLFYELNTGHFAGYPESLHMDDEPYLLAKMMPKVFRASFNGGLQSHFSPEAIREITMSSLSSSELQFLLLPALQGLGTALKAYLEEDPLRGVQVQYLAQNAPKFLGGAQDFGIFLGLLSEHLIEEAAKADPSAAAQTLSEAIETAREALQRTVLDHAWGTRYDDPEDPFFLPGWFKAVSLWLPSDPDEYARLAPQYRASSLYRSTPAWDGWLDFLYAPGR
jgi:hypothetical protein